MAFDAIPTLLGQAAIAAAVQGVAPLDVASIVIGDGGGVAVSPIETQTALVNQRATIPVQEVIRDPATPTRVKITGLIDEQTGGWTIRELGVKNSAGQLLFVASTPATDKRTLADGVSDQLVTGVIVVVSASASITLTPGEGTWATPEYVLNQLELWRTHIAQPLRPYFVAVETMSLNSPPPVVPVGYTAVVPANGGGVYSGHDNQLAQYRGGAGWAFATAPVGSHVAATVDGRALVYRRTTTGWRTLFATIDEHLAGTAVDLFANVAGVQAMITAAFPPDEEGVLYNDGNGNLDWVPRLDIHGLASKASVRAADELAVYDPVLNANRKVTINVLAAIGADSDAIHSDAFFMGMM